MLESRTRVGLGVAAVALVLAASGCAAGQTPPTANSPATNGPLPTQTSLISPSAATGTATPGDGGVVVVLADGPDGVRGLWALDGNSEWRSITSTPTATALGRAANGVAIATANGLEIRPSANLATATTITSLKWTSAPPPIVAVDVSRAGRIALIAADDTTMRYGTAGADGHVTVLDHAPTQSFTPLVEWLGDDSLLVLSTDEQQVSRLAVVDTRTLKLNVVQALSGVRVFAASGDGQVVAAATATGIYVASVATLAAGPAPAPIATLAEGEVVWAMGMDEAGSRLFVLSGQVGSDGIVGAARELGYVTQGSGWRKAVDIAVPFGHGLDQVCLL
jgi:hypothetical protein